MFRPKLWAALQVKHIDFERASDLYGHQGCRKRHELGSNRL